MQNTPQRQKVVRKSVTFVRTASARRTLHIDDYTDEEWFNSFYSPQDYAAFQNDVKRTLRKMMTDGGNSSDVEDDNSFCSRGADYFTQKAVLSRNQIRQVVYNAVNKEQVRQILLRQEEEEEEAEICHEAGCFRDDSMWWLDDEKIAAVYAPYSCASAVAAQKIGRKDETCVLSSYRYPQQCEEPTDEENDFRKKDEPLDRILLLLSANVGYATPKYPYQADCCGSSLLVKGENPSFGLESKRRVLSTLPSKDCPSSWSGGKSSTMKHGRLVQLRKIFASSA